MKIKTAGKKLPDGMQEDQAGVGKKKKKKHSLRAHAIRWTAACSVFLAGSLGNQVLKQQGMDLFGQLSKTLFPSGSIQGNLIGKAEEQAEKLLASFGISLSGSESISEESFVWSPSPDPIDLSSVPEYSGEAYIVIGDNIPEFSQEEYTMGSGIYLSSLDDLGRCGYAFAKFVPSMLPEEERESIGSVHPSGWHTVKYNGLVDGNYLYNRCHLLAYCLTGLNADERNLITGTRYLNIEGMLPFETKTVQYVENTGNPVLYRVTPLFSGDELVARGVRMEGYSTKDGGSGVCFDVYVYNVQPGIVIDYATGDSRLAE